MFDESRMSINISYELHFELTLVPFIIAVTASTAPLHPILSNMYLNIVLYALVLINKTLSTIHRIVR